MNVSTVGGVLLFAAGFFLSYWVMVVDDKPRFWWIYPLGVLASFVANRLWCDIDLQGNRLIGLSARDSPCRQTGYLA